MTDTETKYTPVFKDKDGNRIIFPAPNTLFDDREGALDWQMSEFIFFVPFGLSTDGILEFEATDGKTEIPHVAATLGALGDCIIIGGPMFDEAMQEANNG